MRSRRKRVNSEVMNVRFAIVVAALCAEMIAQTPPSTCPADRPVDDISTEIKKQQSKRNKNLLPAIVCVWGWCHESGRTPPTFPKPAPRVETPDTTQAGEVSSSKTAVDRCNEAMELALEAAHNVEIGDDYFQGKNYKAALWRYTEALEQKPSDSAIQVRLGRVSEKMNDVPQAVEHYRAAEKLVGPENWAQEARSALRRLGGQ
jgi:tetratricopeptide (TPR) repeat protein